MHLAVHGDLIIILSVIGMIYASLIAIRQDDIKRLIAYSSIAHIGLMCAALFSNTTAGMQGVMIQMFNHGINMIGLWIVADVIERNSAPANYRTGRVWHKKRRYWPYCW
jgi:NADH-quinone oxidoreductase subunit M